MPKEDTPVVKARRSQLRRWIDARYGGKQAPFISETGINQGELSGLLSSKSFGEKRARRLEGQAKMPAGFLDSADWAADIGASDIPGDETQDGYVRFQHLDVAAGAGHGVINEDFPEIVRTLVLREEEALALAGRRQTGSIYVAGIATDSMKPTLNPKDLVFIDAAVDHFEGDGIYFFVYEGTLFCKRLQKLPKGKLAVISDNPRYKEWSIDKDDPTPWHIVARVLSALPLKVSALA